MQVPIRDQDAPSSALANPVVAPSPYLEPNKCGIVGSTRTTRCWIRTGGSTIRRKPFTEESASVLRGRIRHPSAKVYPLAGTRSGFVQNSRQVTVYNPETKKFTFIDTCFGTHHLNFAEDANNTLWLSNNTQNELAVVGWVNTKLFWETGDAAKSGAGRR